MTSTADTYSLHPIGFIRSALRTRREAPCQGSEGAPDVWLDLNPGVAPGLLGIPADSEVIVVTWLHQANRDVLQVHPRRNPENPLTGVFFTRSPDRPNPLGLHRVTAREVAGHQLRIGPMEAIDGTPVVDIKAVLDASER
jgi:tRNA-Thr(GGU) m(6)t(6)A37 methyltransferase TsaA